ncbi:Protein of unknown function DUF3667 [Gemmatirosa kalamazoonensis]|uniref:DUF3667 domain-containing protein n=1 Tax=Gemmatirosa kalamazoonensis TaxID=861299 RepID=W0RDU4_9BACT|nr:DUF3667 domain-containing protein [Gemmatirosa kalamazoonensis]AHG88976.1 Protein of unknown function DUF3667 [Gemmatirosa kalamazoonensis]
MSVDVAVPAVSYAPPAPLPAAVPAPAAPCCLNCGTALAGRYCADYGQRAVTERLTVASLAADFAGQFLALDRGLWFTGLAVLRSPGGVAREWLDGRRRRYVGPIGFLSFAAALLLLALQAINFADIDRIRTSARAATAGPHPLFTPRQAEAYAQLMHDMAQQELLLSVLIAIPFALVARRLFRRAGVNLAEMGVVSLFAFADACLLYLPIVPLVWFLGPASPVAATLRSFGTFTVYALATVHAGLGFFGRRTGNAVRMLVALGIAFGIFFAVYGVAAIAYIELTVPR